MQSAPLRQSDRLASMDKLVVSEEALRRVLRSPEARAVMVALAVRGVAHTQEDSLGSTQEVSRARIL